MNSSIALIRALLALATLAGGSIAVHAQTAPAQSRGQLLYTTHCIACHTTQMHWRNDRKAWNWDSLKEQVRRWQGNAGLQWAESDIAEVSRHLNETIYHFPQTVRTGWVPPIVEVKPSPARLNARPAARTSPS